MSKRVSSYRTCVATTLLAVALVPMLGIPTARAQMGGGGQGPAGNPAMDKPDFRDRVWAEGGPRLSGLHQGKLVKGVQIEGNRTISDHKILSFMQTRQDRHFDAKQLQADKRELYRTELFQRIADTIYEYEDGVVIRLDVVEHPTVSEVIFHGNQKISDSMLDRHCGIKAGDPSNPFSTDMARQRLVDLYREKGFNQVAIVTKEGNKAGDRRVYFEIAEGPLERIWAIHFVGNQEFSGALLSTKIKSKDANYGATQYFWNTASLTQIGEDKNRLTAYYRSLGYFNARVDYQVKYHESGKFMDVTFVVDEGPRFMVRDVSVVGNKYFQSDVLMDALKMESGEYFNLAKMNQDQRTLRNEYYGREGFVFVDIVPEPRFLEEPGQLDLVYRISEGDRFRAGEINVHIEGDSSHTRHHVVMNLLGFREGDVIDLKELELSKARLSRSQIFETNPTIGEPPRIQVRPPDQTTDGN